MRHTTTINTESYTQIDRLFLITYALLIASLIVAFPLISSSINSVILFLDGSQALPSVTGFVIGVREHFDGLESSAKIDLLTSVYGMIAIVFLFSSIRVIYGYLNLEGKIHSLLNLALRLVLIVTFISILLGY